MAWVTKIARGKISLASDIHFSPNLFFLLADQRLYIVKIMCVCVCVCIHIYIYDCLRTVYVLLLLSNNNTNASFLYKAGNIRCRYWIRKASRK